MTRVQSSKKVRTAIEPTRDIDFPEWFQQVIKSAELAEHSPVKGCMVIKPWGYAIWERIQSILDRENKLMGCQNAYFPLFIPLSAMQKEADHVEGFAKECAVVTHTRLAQDDTGKLTPDGALDEPLIVRPTSEVMIGEMFAKWIQSYRDMPMKLNQWANVVRMEMRTRLFLRTSEFLWHEAHTCHAHQQEAYQQAFDAHKMYEKVLHDALAIPTYAGEKSPQERFAGADNTFTSEAIMQDGKALQCATAHFLGQHFARSANIQFQNKEGEQALAWTTSWGTTTRLIGALTMVHGDDDGLRLPPAVSPYHVVIMSMSHDDNHSEIKAYAQQVTQMITALSWHHEPVRVYYDERPMRGGEKKWSWVKKGVPIRITIGAKELATKTVSIEYRHQSIQSELLEVSALNIIPEKLNTIHHAYFEQALAYREALCVEVRSKDDLINELKKGHHVIADVCLNSELEDWLSEEAQCSVRCVWTQPMNNVCIVSGQQTNARIIIAKAY